METRHLLAQFWVEVFLEECLGNDIATVTSRADRAVAMLKERLENGSFDTENSFD